MPALQWACENTTGPILELGGGYFSTPFLHSLALDQRDVLTYEYDPHWRQELEERFESLFHKITGEFIDAAWRPWSVVLIDCEGWSRVPFFKALRQYAGVMCIHDSQDDWIPEELLASYRYRKDFGEEPRTTLLSDTVDVTRCP